MLMNAMTDIYIGKYIIPAKSQYFTLLCHLYWSFSLIIHPHDHQHFKQKWEQINISGYFIIRENPFHTFNFNHNLCVMVWNEYTTQQSFRIFLILRLLQGCMLSLNWVELRINCTHRKCNEDVNLKKTVYAVIISCYSWWHAFKTY